MNPKPFVRLAAPWAVNRSELPPELAEFYARYEGVGLESSSDRVVRLCKLDEVTLVGWTGLGEVGDVPEGWEQFVALLIGWGMYFEKIVYVLDAPSCPPGSVLMIGSNVCGPGGNGPFILESSLVLAASFAGWLAHLERWGWAEPGIAPVWDLTEQERQELTRYYLTFNPDLYLGPANDSS